MRPSADSPVLMEAVKRLLRACAPTRIYLFGSAARGDAGPDSDLDFLLVIPKTAPITNAEFDRAYRALRGTGIAADVILIGESEFNRRLHLKASFPSTVVREGRLLYAA